MKARAVAALFFITAYSISADSLWDPESPGLLTGAGELNTGDVILVSIDLNQDLSYSSSRIDSERVSIELSGGEGQDLFSFLPSGASQGNQSLQGRESLSLQTSFAVAIVGIDDNGQLLLRGGRTVSIQGKEESVTLTGVADPALVGQDRSLPFSSIVNARLVYDTFLSTASPLIGAGDIVDVEVAAQTGGQPIAQPTTAATEEAAAGAAASAAASAAVVAEPVTKPELTESKRRELLLLYLNRLIDLVFE
jgi:hypothetical protein